MTDKAEETTGKQNDSADHAETRERQSSDRQRERPQHKPSRESPSSSRQQPSNQRRSSGPERASSHERAEGSSGEGTRSGNSNSGGKPKLTAAKAVRSALEQFTDLTRRQPESVVGVRKSDEGWTVRLEVVESRRIPDTADLLAVYEVELDSEGDILSYDRKDRYVRGHPSD